MTQTNPKKCNRKKTHHILKKKKQKKYVGSLLNNAFLNQRWLNHICDFVYKEMVFEGYFVIIWRGVYDLVESGLQLATNEDTTFDNNPVWEKYSLIVCGVFSFVYYFTIM